MRARTVSILLLSTVLWAGCTEEVPKPPSSVDLLARAHRVVDLEGRPFEDGSETVSLQEELRAGGSLVPSDGEATVETEGKLAGFWLVDMKGFRAADLDSLSVRITAPGPGTFFVDLRFDDERVERRTIEYTGTNSPQTLGLHWPPEVRRPSTHPVVMEIHTPAAMAGRFSVDALSLHRSPHARRVLGRVDHQARRCVEIEPGAAVEWDVLIPENAVLKFGANLAVLSGEPSVDGLVLQAQWIDSDGAARQLWQRELTRAEDAETREWDHARIELTDLVGQRGVLRFGCAGERDGLTTLLLSNPTLTLSAEARRPNVVVLVIDSLRADGLGLYGNERAPSPNIDALADESVVFEQAHSTAPWTLPSTATLFTGMQPNHHGVGMVRKRSTTFRENTTLLTERFKAAGYATAAVTDNRLVASDRGFSPGVDQFDERSLRGGLNHGGERVTRYALEWLERHADESFFLYLHYFDPHWPYRAPAPHTQMYVGDQMDRRMRNSYVRRGDFSQLRKSLSKIGRPLDMNDPKSSLTVDYLRALYDAETFYCDSEIGKLLRYLRVTDAWENTIVLITSDHGEEFADHGWLGHGHSLYEDLLHIPLLIRFPDATGAGQRVDAPVSNQDFAATVLGAAGLPMLGNEGFSDFDLHAALRAGTLETRGPLYASGPGVDENKGLPGKHGPKQMMLEWPDKLIYSLGSGGLELYDLDTDPGELDPYTPATQPDRIDEMLLRLDAAMQRPEGWEAGVTKMSPQLENELRALGYVD